jgi:Flp pilus assembly pilin Flp
MPYSETSIPYMQDSTPIASLVQLRESASMAEYAFSRSLADDLGQDLVEYAVLLAFVALAVIAGMEALGAGITGSYDDSTSIIESAEAGADGDSGGDSGAPQPGKGKGRRGKNKKPKP